MIIDAYVIFPNGSSAVIPVMEDDPPKDIRVPDLVGGWRVRHGQVGSRLRVKTVTLLGEWQEYADGAPRRLFYRQHCDVCV